MQDQSRSPNIYFDTAFVSHLIRVYYCCISYPTVDIVLWDNDVSGAYRLPKYNPAVASAFAYAILSWLMLPSGSNFGSTTSPHKYECFARARAYLAEILSREKSLVDSLI